ncbi:MAG: mechanosensitive ion channel [Chitinophagales bacterium]
MEKLQLLANNFLHVAEQFAPKIAGALLVFIIGLWLTNWVTQLVTRAMVRRGLDVSLQSFLSSLLSVSLKVLLLITVAGMMGIQTTSFVAVLGAAGLAVGLALQGSLSNFAGGVLTLVFKPYKVGDLIEAQGQFGEVKEIQIFNTILLTPENKTAILPNGAVSNGTIVNYSRHGDLRVDLTVAVSPDMNISKVREVIAGVFDANEKVLKTPEPTVNVLKMADGMVTLAVRPYATPADYWAVYFGIQEQIKIAFEQAGIEAPVPHRIIINK